MSEVAIEVKNLKKYFYNRGVLTKAIDDVSLKVEQGEIVGLVGESGSGKTTLARTILGLIKPTDGQVLLKGIDLKEASKKQMKTLRRSIAVIFQDPASNLNPRESVLSSITRPLILQGIPKKDARQRAEEVLKLVKLDAEYLFTYPHQLSGGQLQRIAIARAIAMEPDVMILDEPTSALDISVQAGILNLLLELQERLGLTYLVITHDMNVIRYICDRVAVMYQGKIVECAGCRDIFTSPGHEYTQKLLNALPSLSPPG